LAACAPAGPVIVEATQAPPTTTPVPTPTNVPPQPTPIPVDIPAAARAAITVLMGQLNLTADQIKVVSVQEMEWPDGCLGVVHIGMQCTDVIVPGFLVILEANGVQYEFHTNQDGSLVVPAEGTTPVVASEALIKAASEALAKVLNLKLADIKFVSAQLVEWPDSCLGMALPGVACSQIVTPGYLIVLEANGVQFEYHTNADGSAIVPGTLALVWQRVGGIAGFCDTLVLFRSGEVDGNWCKPQAGATYTTQGVTLTADEQAQLNDWLAKYGTVSISQGTPPDASDAMTVTLTLYGTGSAQPAEAEQQAMLDFASTVFTRIQK
jgi:hypothetical protein